jgi:hypothetical protein
MPQVDQAAELSAGLETPSVAITEADWPGSRMLSFGWRAPTKFPDHLKQKG